MRPSRRDSLLAIAAIVAQRGTCDRKQVGAVIAREGRIISIGYNGAPPGLPHCEQNGHGWGVWHPGEGDRSDMREMLPEWQHYANLDDMQLARMPWDWKGGTEYLASLRGCRNATHAEANALAFAARYGVATDQAELYVTLAPCETCARLLIAAGIILVEYEEPYRDRSGIELLKSAGIRVCSSN